MYKSKYLNLKSVYNTSNDNEYEFNDPNLQNQFKNETNIETLKITCNISDHDIGIFGSNCYELQGQGQEKRKKTGCNDIRISYWTSLTKVKLLDSLTKLEIMHFISVLI